MNKVLDEKIAAMEQDDSQSFDLTSPLASKSADTAMPSNADLMKMLTVMNTNLDTKFETYTASTNKQLTTISKDVVTNRNEINSLKSKLKSYEATANTLQYTIELEKQSKLRNNITVSNVPSIKDDNLNVIVLNIFNFICAGVSEDDIISTYRLPFNNIIVVKFSSFEAKAAVLDSKSNRKILLSDIMSTEHTPLRNDTQIYVNTHLTPFFGHILGKGRQLVREGKLHSCWMGNSGINAKLAENDEPKKIHSVIELKKYAGATDDKPKPRNSQAAKNNTNRTTSATRNNNNKRSAAEQETSPINSTHTNKNQKSK